MGAQEPDTGAFTLSLFMLTGVILLPSEIIDLCFFPVMSANLFCMNSQSLHRPYVGRPIFATDHPNCCCDVYRFDYSISVVGWYAIICVQRVEKVASHREWSKGLNTQLIPLELRKPVMFQ